jgi:FMN phosphatase YigB (HAD superfamily)
MNAATQGPTLSGVLLDVGGTLWSERWTSDTPLLAARMQSALPSASSTQIETLHEEFTRLAGSVDWSVEQDVDQLIASAGSVAALRLWPDDTRAVRRAMCLPAAGRGECFPGTRDLLLTIRRLGLRCAIVSNVLVRAAEDYRQDFADYGLDDLVEAIVTSIETRVRKPDSRIFEVALRAIDCGATNVVMVGNSEVNDIEPAVKLGMRSIRVAIEEPPPAQSKADLVATTLFAVAEQIERWIEASGANSRCPIG